MKKLPVGIHTFRKIINNNCLYVDKTEDIYRLITGEDYVFLSRPRRFGKSLLVSALKEIFLGNKEFFKGFYIYDKILWEKFPVIHIDFSKIVYSKAEDTFVKSIIKKLVAIGKNYDVKLNNIINLKECFEELIEKLGKINKVVILIDEYDKPIIDHITDINKASRNREVLREFYSVIKGSDEFIKFVFITGVSKFSKVSIFSGLNNLKDLTLRKEFSTIMGITNEELIKCFPSYIKELAKEEEMGREEVLEKIKFWYDGYSWDGMKRLYNPFSILNLFDSRTFDNYWFSSGTTTFLINLIKKEKYELTNLEEVIVSKLVFDSYDLDYIDINSLLFQTGYLSIKSVDKKLRLYTLTCPNLEVRESFFSYLLGEFVNEKASLLRPLYIKLGSALKNDKIEEFIKIMRSVFAGIPYNLHMPAESYYHSLFYMILTLMGVKVDLEVLTDKGRIDGVLEFDEKVFVIEFKYGEPGSKMEKILDKAMGQIRDKKYYEKFMAEGKRVVFLGVGFVGKEIGYRVDREAGSSSLQGGASSQ